MLFVRECLACGVHISDTDKVKTTRETSNFTVHNYEEGRKRLILTRNPFQLLLCAYKFPIIQKREQIHQKFI